MKYHLFVVIQVKKAIHERHACQKSLKVIILFARQRAYARAMHVRNNGAHTPGRRAYARAARVCQGGAHMSQRVHTQKVSSERVDFIRVIITIVNNPLFLFLVQVYK